MKINMREDAETGAMMVNIAISKQYLNECEPIEYGLSRLITHEQGLSIIEDAILLSMKLRRVHPRTITSSTKEAEEHRGRKSAHPCAKCGAMEVYVEEISDHPDYRITCHACKHSYCVDGPDA